MAVKRHTVKIRGTGDLIFEIDENGFCLTADNLQMPAMQGSESE